MHFFSFFFLIQDTEASDLTYDLRDLLPLNGCNICMQIPLSYFHFLLLLLSSATFLTIPCNIFANKSIFLLIKGL